MRILQINTVYKEKSTGRTCMEIERALIKRGHQCCTAYGVGRQYGGNTYRINTKIEYYLHNVLSQLTGLEGYFSIFATRRLIKFIDKYNPDVVHLRNLHGHYINLPMLFKYLGRKQIPVIQNLHDHWAFTGKCTYYTTIGCYKWIENCGGCPMLKEYPRSIFFDTSRKLRKDKEKWYKKLNNLTVIGVSEWTSNEARKSFFKDCAKDIFTIYNWIDLHTFQSYDSDVEATRKKYNIPSDKFVIIGVSAAWMPGSPRYIDFMEISRNLNEDEILVMVGRADGDLSDENIIHIPYVSDTVELARLYSCADVYIHCSVEDTFGKVIAEAQACGTPVIVYDVTACPEVVGKNCGYIVKPRSTDEVLQKIAIVKRKGKVAFSSDCKTNVSTNFNYEQNSEKLIRVYETVANTSRAAR
jgi:glycosyltransferase involved in cell wall biosynthesis